MDILTQFEWVVVFVLAVSGSVALNYENMARQRGWGIGAMFFSSNPRSFWITLYSFLSVIVPIIFAIIYGKWWYGVIIFFAGLSVGAGLLILMFREKSQILALLGMAVGSILFGYAVILRQIGRASCRERV